MDGILTHLALLTPAFSLPSAPAVLTVNLQRPWNAPLPLIVFYESAISVLCLAPVHLRRSVTRLVSYYALFKGWLLLSQPPSCFDNSTSFPTSYKFWDLHRRSWTLFLSRMDVITHTLTPEYVNYGIRSLITLSTLR